MVGHGRVEEGSERAHDLAHLTLEEGVHLEGVVALPHGEVEGRGVAVIPVFVILLVDEDRAL